MDGCVERPVMDCGNDLQRKEEELQSRQKRGGGFFGGGAVNKV